MALAIVSHEPPDPVEACATCNAAHVRDGRPTCTAHSSQRKRETGELTPCKRYPLRGALTCPSHGSATLASRKRAAQVVRDMDSARIVPAYRTIDDVMDNSENDAARVRAAEGIINRNREEEASDSDVRELLIRVRERVHRPPQ